MGTIIDFSHLTSTEIFILSFCQRNPSYKFTGGDLKVINTLQAYGLADFEGNLQYRVTSLGEDILADVAEHRKKILDEELAPHPQEELIPI